MLLTRDIYKIELLKEGASRMEVIANSSINYLDFLKSLKLIKIDYNDKVYLTDKGKIARKFGLRKYLELEKLEQKALSYDSGQLKRQSLFFIIIFLISIIIIAYLNHILV